MNEQDPNPGYIGVKYDKCSYCGAMRKLDQIAECPGCSKKVCRKCFDGMATLCIDCLPKRLGISSSGLGRLAFYVLKWLPFFMLYVIFFSLFFGFAADVAILRVLGFASIAAVAADLILRSCVRR